MDDDTSEDYNPKRGPRRYNKSKKKKTLPKKPLLLANPSANNGQPPIVHYCPEFGIGVGDKFSSYKELSDKVREGEDRTNTQLTIRDSRTLENAYRRAPNRVEGANLQLLYFNIHLNCVFGGRKYKGCGLGLRKRNVRSRKQDCNAGLKLNLTEDKQHLVVTSVNYEHNHVVSKDIYTKLPRQRRIQGKYLEEAANMLQANVSKKMVKLYLQETTGKRVTNKDMHNINARINLLNMKKKEEDYIIKMECTGGNTTEESILPYYIPKSSFAGPAPKGNPPPQNKPKCPIREIVIEDNDIDVKEEEGNNEEDEEEEEDDDDDYHDDNDEEDGEEEFRIKSEPFDSENEYSFGYSQNVTSPNLVKPIVKCNVSVSTQTEMIYMDIEALESEYKNLYSENAILKAQKDRKIKSPSVEDLESQCNQLFRENIILKTKLKKLRTQLKERDNPTD